MHRAPDPSGAVVDSRSYDAFGLPVSISNPTGSQKGFASAFGYQEDADSGLKLLGHRYYDPATGRFITRDPIGSGTNWYRYADNNPLKQVDPDGLTPQDIRDYDKANGTDYTGQVEARIKSLRENGEVAAAKQLELMLSAGEIRVDPDQNGFKLHYPDGTSYYASAYTSDDGITLSLGMFKNGSYATKFLESTLLHEEVHWYARHHGIPGNELFSTEAEIAYARRRASKKMPDGSQDDWSEIAKSAKRYQQSWIGHDRKVLIPWIFRGFPWR